MSNVIITWKYSFFCIIRRRRIVWSYVAVQNGCLVIHIIVEKVNKLLTSLYADDRQLDYRKYVTSDYLTQIKQAYS